MINATRKAPVDITIRSSSIGGFEFEVVNGSDQVETQGKTFSPVSVTFTENTKNLQAANDIFNQDTLTR